MMKPIPCLHLIATADCFQGCGMEWSFPEDCEDCPDYIAGVDERERIRREVWTHVMGYHRPTSQFNAEKRAEHKERRYFKEKKTRRKLKWDWME